MTEYVHCMKLLSFCPSIALGKRVGKHTRDVGKLLFRYMLTQKTMTTNILSTKLGDFLFITIVKFDMLVFFC